MNNKPRNIYEDHWFREWGITYPVYNHSKKHWTYSLNELHSTEIGTKLLRFFWCYYKEKNVELNFHDDILDEVMTIPRKIYVCLPGTIPNFFKRLIAI